MLDLGAGDGAITLALVAAGARVIAFELHPERAARLRRCVTDDDVKVVVADVADLRLPTRPFHVVSNPPFNATQAILRRLTSPGSRLVQASMVVPAHVARRWSSGRAPGSARWQQQFAVSMARRLPAAAFRPPGPAAGVLVVTRR
ncbi:MAG: rRNA adenine N-6-methyltransferase family protein [Acidimicrobiales bacterium]